MGWYEHIFLRHSRLLLGRLNKRFIHKGKAPFLGQILIILRAILRNDFLIAKVLKCFKMCNPSYRYFIKISEGQIKSV